VPMPQKAMTYTIYFYQYSNYLWHRIKKGQQKINRRIVKLVIISSVLIIFSSAKITKILAINFKHYQI